MRNWRRMEWEEIKKMLKGGNDLDFLSSREILVLCCSGMSNNDISTFLLIEEEDIKSTISEYLEFDGFDKTININPLFFYRKLVKDDKIDSDNYIKLLIKFGLTNNVAATFCEICEHFCELDADII